MGWLESLDWQLYLTIFSQRYLAALVRAIVLLGGLYFIFWVIQPQFIKKFRVQPPTGAKPQPKKEIFFTLTAYIVYALVGVGVVFVQQTTGHSMMYTNVNEMGLFYTVSSFFIFLFFVDTAFYWSHVLMHKSRFVYRAHRAHHKFINVTPFAAYAFHTGEAFINAGAFFIMLMVLPYHPTVLFLFVVATVSYNGYIHSGYDFSAKWTRENLFLKWLNTPTHHILHHQRFNCNYAFIFTFWDKLMGTEVLLQSSAPEFSPKFDRQKEVENFVVQI